MPRGELTVAAPEGPRTVFEAPDDVLLAPLGAAPVTRLKLNHGGTSLSLRVEFANGARAAFKPEQVHPQSDPRREIAAYKLDRLLGIGRVPPAKATRLSVEQLLAAVEPSHRTFIGNRLRDEAIAQDGMLRGELSWWIPEIKLAKLGRFRIDEKDGRDLWTAYLQVGAPIPEDVRPLVTQIAALVMFDVLIDNPDRWTGGNTVTSPDGGTLYFMDNTMSFTNLAFGGEQNLTAFRKIQVFPRKLVQRIRALTPDMLDRALAIDPDHGLGPLLTDVQKQAILARRDNMLRHIDRLILEHGADAVLALP